MIPRFCSDEFSVGGVEKIWYANFEEVEVVEGAAGIGIGFETPINFIALEPNLKSIDFQQEVSETPNGDLYNLEITVGFPLNTIHLEALFSTFNPLDRYRILILTKNEDIFLLGVYKGLKPLITASSLTDGDSTITVSFNSVSLRNNIRATTNYGAFDSLAFSNGFSITNLV
jgi:hypothetical protein